MQVKVCLFVILSSLSVVICGPITEFKTNLHAVVESVYSEGPGKCPAGRIKSIRFAVNGDMFVKIDSLREENYTNVEHLYEPLMWAFYLDAEIQLNTNTCEDSDRGFGSFSILSFNKPIDDVLSDKTNIEFIPLTTSPKP